ncbi:MAG: heavy-metal-associated domain-containing protein [Candidatus Diapherotrites archaeon]|nr:heavy-metal-associated domain-containing protein [Candidatus Diapherotrites archaeon]
MEKEFIVKGMHCPSCVAVIKMNLEEVKGVKSVKGDEKKRIVKVNYDKNVAKLNEIVKSIEKDGYTVEK